jgi:S1-C subfamily serine protease
MHPGRPLILLLFLLGSCVSGLSQSQAGSPVSEVAKQHSKSIVQIVAQDRNGKELGTGSGFIVKSEGVVVTNYHVIERAHTASIRTAG